jgi:VWFA-related protein
LHNGVFFAITQRQQCDRRIVGVRCKGGLIDNTVTGIPSSTGACTIHEHLDASIDTERHALQTTARARELVQGKDRKCGWNNPAGGDNHSRYNAREVLSAVSEAGVQIYAKGIFDEAPRGKAERIGPSLLGSITDSTGGKTFPIHSLKDIRDMADRLAIELRNQYLLAYHPNSLVHDGKWHKISVRVTPPPNSPRLRVYAKMGYYAPAQ